MPSPVGLGDAKIVCLGLSRTGTSSLSSALNRLGIKTLHYSLEAFVQQEVLDASLSFRPQLPLSPYKRWRLENEINAKRVRSFERILTTYQGFSDLPFAFWFRELHGRFPSAKFIYTYRDERKWLESMDWLYHAGAVTWRHGLLDSEMKNWAYGTALFDEKKLLTAFRRHADQVSNYFRNSPQFLSLNLDAGELHYRPITSFLGLPLLDEPVERTNLRVSPTEKQTRSYRLEMKYDAVHGCRLVIRTLKRAVR